MVFRLPTHLQSFIPPPSEQVPQMRPWRGTLIVNGLRPSDRGSSHEIRVTAVETDGDNRFDLWPTEFFAMPTHDRPVLRDVQAWVHRNAPPLCTFLPDRLRNPNENTVNQSNFRSFSRILFENQMVAIATWNTDKIRGAGLIIYPAANSSALLVAALFLSSPFPEFIASSVGPLSPMATHHGQAGYQASMGTSYGSTSRHPNPIPSSSSHRFTHDIGSPANLPSPQQGDQYRYIMPRPITLPYNTTASLSSADPSWSAIKDEEDGGAFNPTLGSHQPDPRFPQ